MAHINYDMLYQQQNILIKKQALEIKNQLLKQKPYTQSQYNNQFDKSLKHLVTYYKFDFQKIALHLYYQFPQNQYKMTPKSIAFRWWQLLSPLYWTNAKLSILEQYQIRQSSQKQIKNQNKNMQNQHQQEKKINKGNKNINISHFKLALQMSKSLSEQQNQSFLLYKPKFVNDSEYKLQINNSSQIGYQKQFFKSLKQVIDNQFLYQFGNFSGMAQIAAAVELLESKSEQKYLQLSRFRFDHKNIQKQDIQFFQYMIIGQKLIVWRLWMARLAKLLVIDN